MAETPVEVKVTYTVTNIIGKIKSGPICMDSLSNLPGVKYNKHKFPAAFLKLENGSCNIFRTGTITFLGYKTVASMHKAVAELADRLGELYHPVEVEPNICNIVCTFKVINAKTVDLNILRDYFNSQKKSQAIYEPDIWNGLHLTISKSIKAIVHYTCSGILTGSKTEQDLRNALCHVAEGIAQITLKRQDDTSGQQIVDEFLPWFE